MVPWTRIEPVHSPSLEYNPTCWRCFNLLNLPAVSSTFVFNWAIHWTALPSVVEDQLYTGISFCNMLIVTSTRLALNVLSIADLFSQSLLSLPLPSSRVTHCRVSVLETTQAFPLELQYVREWLRCRMCFVCYVILAAIKSNIGAAGYPTHRGFSHEFSIHIDRETAFFYMKSAHAALEPRIALLSRAIRTTVYRRFQRQK